MSFNSLPYIDVNSYVALFFDAEHGVYILSREEKSIIYDASWQMDIVNKFFDGRIPEMGEWEKWYKAGRYVQEEMIADFMFHWCND